MDDYDKALLVIDPEQLKLRDDAGKEWILSERAPLAGGQYGLRFFLSDDAPQWLKDNWNAGLKEEGEAIYAG